MNFDSLVKQLANRINQPQVIRHYLLVVWRTALKEAEKKQLHIPVVSNWVAVEEKLPPKYENVIIRNENNIVTTDQISDNGWVFEEISKVKVTHWMHLPKPPCC